MSAASRLTVVVRTRPTAAFAQDEILIDASSGVRTVIGQEAGS